MAYDIIVSPRTEREIEDAIDFYTLHASDAPAKFIQALQECYDSLALNPFFRIRYKNIRTLKIKKFPYSIYFVIHKQKQVVKVLSCFHNKRNPKKRPRYL